MDSKRIPKAIRQPVPELMEFLKPYREVFSREEPRQTLERYITGLLSDLPRKNGQTIGEYLEGISYHRIYQFLVTNRWDEQRLESIRIRQLTHSPVHTGTSSTSSEGRSQREPLDDPFEYGNTREKVVKNAHRPVD